MGTKIIYFPKYHKFVSLSVGEEKLYVIEFGKMSFGVECCCGINFFKKERRMLMHGRHK